MTFVIDLNDRYDPNDYLHLAKPKAGSTYVESGKLKLYVRMNDVIFL